MSAPNERRPASMPRRGMFQGDVDVIELRRRLSISADVIPEPPLLRQRSAPRSLGLAKFALSVGVLSIIFWGVLEGARSNGAYPVYPSPTSGVASPTRPDNATLSATATEPVTEGLGTRPTKPVLLGIHDRRAVMNEPLALGAV